MRALLAIFLLTASTAKACVNIDGVTIDGKYRQVLAIGQQDTPPILREALEAQPSSRLVKLTKTGDVEQINAVRDIYAGNYAAAIEKLEAIEAARPGDYRIAANLGTAYELAGNNEKALHWIAEGIKRNPQSHYGSEWLHKKILETKIAMENDPNLLNKEHIVPLAESSAWMPDASFEIDGQSYPNYELARTLHYQLGERMLFVKPTDPVVADLLYSFAILEASTRTLEPAVELLQLAKEYGYHDTADLDARIARYQQIIDGTWKITGKDIVGGFTLIALLSLPLMLVVTIVRAFLRHLRARRLSISS